MHSGQAMLLIMSYSSISNRVDKQGIQGAGGLGLQMREISQMENCQKSTIIRSGIRLPPLIKRRMRTKAKAPNSRVYLVCKPDVTEEPYFLSSKARLIARQYISRGVPTKTWDK
jgi:hypothetical protein